jgi:hypothetical protein
MHSRSTFALGRGAAAALALLAPTIPAAAAPKGAPTLSKVDDAAVERARAGATRKLQEPECQKVVEDFKDREGRPLRQSLEKYGVGAAEYVQMIAFRLGARHPRCLRGNAALVSTPGLPQVYVCGSFAGRQPGDDRELPLARSAALPTPVSLRSGSCAGHFER